MAPFRCWMSLVLWLQTNAAVLPHAAWFSLAENILKLLIKSEVDKSGTKSRCTARTTQQVYRQSQTFPPGVVPVPLSPAKATPVYVNGALLGTQIEGVVVERGKVFFQISGKWHTFTESPSQLIFPWWSSISIEFQLAFPSCHIKELLCVLSEQWVKWDDNP